MIWLWIGMTLFATFLCLLLWSACKLGAKTDEKMHDEFQKWMEGHSPQADGYFHGEVMNDANGA